MKPNPLHLVIISILFTLCQSIGSIATASDVYPWYYDGDKDGYGDPYVFVVDSVAPAGYILNGSDCDDTNADIHPGVLETCNHIDDNCDGSTDEGVQSVFYADNDFDGYGNPSSTILDCSAPAGYVPNNTDCNDTNAMINSGATEICNGLDDDCSGTADDNIVADISIDWQKTFGGSGADQTLSIEATLDGGFIMSGKTYSNNGNVSSNHGKSDAWVIKIDASGNIVWQKTYGGTGDESANVIRSLNDGNYILACVSNSLNGDITGNHGGSDFWIVKIDASGNILWQYSYGGSSEDIPYGLDLTADGGFIVAGCTKSSNGNVTGSHSNGDYWIIKLDANGTLLWEKSYGGSGFDFAYTIVKGTNGGYVTSGYARSTDGDVLGNHGQEDVWILNLDSAGNMMWQKSYGGTGGEGANSMQVTSDGGYIINGVTHSYNLDVVGNNGDHDFWVLKLDNQGNIEWKRCLGGSATDNGTAVRQTSDGGYIVSGFSDSNDDDLTLNHGRHDFWIVKLSSAGSIEWQKSIGGSMDDEPYAIVQIIDGAYLIAGLTNSNNGDVSGNHGNGDVWIARILPSVLNTFYLDADGDSYGDHYISVTSCFAPGGYVANSSDCNDANADVNPGKTETCNGIDDNCDSYTDENAVIATISPLETVTICNTSSLLLTCNTGSNYTYQWKKNGINLPAATNAEYTVKGGGAYSVVISDGSCSSNSPATIIKVTYQVAAVKPSGTITICDGTSVNLSVTANPGILFQWKNSSAIIPGATSSKYNATSAGSYSVTESDVTGCSFSSATSTVQSNPSPSATVSTSGSLNICSSGSVMLSVSQTSGATYQWYKDNGAILGATLASYSATVAGSFKVLVTSQNGCTKYSSPLKVKSCKMDENSEKEERNTLSCFPNPSDGNFAVNFEMNNSYNGDARVQVSNFIGQIILFKDEIISEGRLSDKIYLESQVTPGLYLIKLQADNIEYVSPLIITN